MQNKSDLIIYTTEDGLTKIDVTFDDNTVWLSQADMAELFQKAKSTINEHIKNIYDEGELIQEQTMRKFGNSEFSTKPTNYYNLDVVISVGYRVKSQRGIQFRLWASKIIKEYMKKGFGLDSDLHLAVLCFDFLCKGGGLFVDCFQSVFADSVV